MVLHAERHVLVSVIFAIRTLCVYSGDLIGARGVITREVLQIRVLRRMGTI